MKIVYFAPIAYDGLKQRPQYIAEELAREYDVYYIEPTIRLTSCILHGGKEYKGKMQCVSKNLTVVRCNGTFVLPFRWNVYDVLSWNGMLERHYLRHIINMADIIIVGYEGWMNVLTSIKGKKIVYDKMDDNILLSQAWQVRRYLARAEKKLLRKAVCMITTAQKFLEDYQERIESIHLVPNGVKIETNEIPKTFDNHEGVVYGYVGMISDWFDMEVVKLISEAEDAKVVLVGPCDIDKYEKENIIYTGRIPKKEVTNMIQAFDVCLYPFKQGELLDTINPVKLYEYLALNKPVIAVDSRETRAFGNLLYRYHSLDELKSLCQRELSTPFENDGECVRFIEENSWEARTEQIKKILEEL